MIVTDITRDLFSPERIVGLADADPALPPRSSGVHLSDIYSDLEDTIRKTTREPMEERELAFYRAGGFLWERVFSYAMAESFRTGTIVRPGEYMVEGITGSPDNIRTDLWRVVETKCTWRSMQKLERLEKNFWIWLVQMKGYCRLVGTTEAELYAFFVMGDYKGSGPQGKALLFQWSQYEIEENWQMLKNHGRRRGMLIK